MKLIQLVMLMVALLALHGCGFKDVADVDVKEAILYSPEGEFEFKRDKKYPLSFRAHDKKHSVVITLFPSDGDSILRFYNKKVIIKSKKAYYQLNNGRKNTLKIKSNWSDPKAFTIISPPTMSYYQADGDGLHVTRQRKKITHEDKRKVSNETYRYYIPFSIDNKNYAIDVTFKLDIDTTLRFGVPGMP